MFIDDFTGCCKARIYGGFGRGHVTEHDRNTAFSKEQIMEDFERRIRMLQNAEVQVVYATPTNHQKDAIAALKELGFVSVAKRRLKEVERDQGYYFNDRKELAHQMIPMIFLVPPQVGTKLTGNRRMGANGPEPR